MNRERTMTAFYLETVLMVVIFVIVIAILSQVFGIAKAQSGEARQLTDAVCLAQNAAEAVAASGNENELGLLLDEKGRAGVEEEDGTATVTAYYGADLQQLTEEEAAADEASLRLQATWEPEESKQGTFVKSNISVYSRAEEDPVYTLNTGVYLGEKEGRR